MKIVIKCVT